MGKPSKGTEATKLSKKFRGRGGIGRGATVAFKPSAKLAGKKAAKKSKKVLRGKARAPKA